MRPPLLTPRISLEPLRRKHLDHLVALDADPEVMRHLIGRARTPEEAHEHWLPLCSGMTADRWGLGFWAGFADGDFVGWWVAAPPLPIAGRPTTAELGWRLCRRRWGLGLATEGARAVVDHCFGTVGLESLTAETMAVNEASRQVMRKLGMRHVRTEVREWDEPLPGAERGEVIYELVRADWTAAAAAAGSGGG